MNGETINLLKYKNDQLEQ